MSANAKDTLIYLDSYIKALYKLLESENIEYINYRYEFELAHAFRKRIKILAELEQ